MNKCQQCEEETENEYCDICIFEAEEEQEEIRLTYQSLINN